MAPKGAVCVFECLSANLALQEFFQAINFHFTQTSKHQPTRNLHSSAQLFAVTPSASHFHAYISASCDKIPQNSRVLARQMANCFVVLDHLLGKFVDCIIKLLFCRNFLAYCGFPNIFIDVVDLVMIPRPWPRLLSAFKAWLLSTRSYFNLYG